MAFFKGFFSNSGFDKSYMTSYIFCFTMMSLVISQLSCFRLAEIRRKGSRMKVLSYLLSSWLNPNGTSVFSFWIQKFSLISNIFCSASWEPCKFSSLLMMMNLACLLSNLACPFSWKCLQARMELASVSFLCLFNLRLNAVSAFPAYCILHKFHYINNVFTYTVKVKKNVKYSFFFVGSWMCLLSALGCDIELLCLINMECIFLF